MMRIRREGRTMTQGRMTVLIEIKVK